MGSIQYCSAVSRCTLLVTALLALSRRTAVFAQDAPVESERIQPPNLPLGDINVVILTDTHSWVGGHGEKEEFDVDYGDVLSFYRLLQGQIAELELQAASTAAVNGGDDGATPQSAQSPKHDLFLVMNGDWIDGTGLALNGDPSYLVPILEKMPWDAVNIGNHELYKESVIDYVTRPGGLAAWWWPKYLSSNILLTRTQQPVGTRYHVLKGKHHNVLVFGFLYNMQDNDPAVTVETVEDTVAQEWFKEALLQKSGTLGQSDYHAIMVLAHMDHADALINVILTRIRQFVSADMPVQFVTGHTHYRGYSKPDNYSSSFEPGRYLDTVGFVSFPTQASIQRAVAAKQAAEAAAKQAAEIAAKQAEEAAAPTQSPDSSAVVLDPNPARSGNVTVATVPPTTSPTVAPTQGHHAEVVIPSFEHVFLDAKYSTLTDALNEDLLVTEEGLYLSNFIYQVQEDLGLFEIVGCVKHDHFVKYSMDKNNSLWGMFCKHVVPHVFHWKNASGSGDTIGQPANDGNPKVVLMGKGALRYDLHARELILDEIIGVSPFNESLYMFQGVPGDIVTQVNATLNGNSPDVWQSQLPSWIMCDSPAASLPQPGDPAGTDTLYDLVVAEFALSRVRQVLEEVWPQDDDQDDNITVTTPAPPMPDAVPCYNHTSTSLWLEFFDKTDLCQTENKGQHKKKRPKHQPKTNQTDQKNETGGGGGFAGNFFSGKKFGGDESKLDKFRVDFVWVAVAVVVALTAVYVHQRSRIWRQRVSAQERATLEAEEEFNDQHGLNENRYRDEPSAEEQWSDEENEELDGIPGHALELL